MEIEKTDISKNSDWEDFLNTDYNMFYDKRFLCYNDEFGKNIKWHHLLFRERNKVIAILPGNEIQNETDKTFVSCDGVSFGGFLWRDKLKIMDFLNVIEKFKSYLSSNGFNKCLIRNSPYIYQKNANEEYEYALILSGFNVSRYSITNIVDLNNFEFEKLKNPKKRSIQKSAKMISIDLMEENINEDTLREFYDILYSNRELKHVRPTHTLEELVYLKNVLKYRIKLFTAKIENKVVGICTLFLVKDDVVLNFYLAADEEHKKDRVSDYLLYKTIEWSKLNNYRLYDIGTSNVGNELLQGLFDFKKKFMADGFLRKSYTLNL
ncbi:MAG: GNAT family N-acetyltransferase [Ignavibacteria bacterium]|nr:GNAT family N-acetyltransferase [Ignavibacteria bacterium]